MSNSKKYSSEEIAAIDLMLGPDSLAILRTPRAVMDTPQAPKIALVELVPDIYAFGGETLEMAARRRGAQLVPFDSIDTHDATPSIFPSCVRLLIGRSTLSAFKQSQSAMDGWCPPSIGMVDFGGTWRIAGDIIADYIEKNGARVYRSGDLDSNGYDNRGENTFN